METGRPDADSRDRGEPRGDGQRFGRYVLYDEIAAGGMASVHIARLLGPAGFSRTVAIKRMRGELVRDPDFLAMFLDEARLAARVHHPNVVQVLDVVPAGREVLLVMEYVRGESLGRLVRSAPAARLPVPVALAIATDVLYGLHAAHEATTEQGERLHIVHRDVSPQNILVGADGIARVTDFGIAKAAVRANSTRDGQLKGKLSYMAPEQVRRGRLDRRTDVFAASTVIWEMLTGERLFRGDDEASILHSILFEPVRRLSSSAAGVPEALDAIVMKGLAHDPEDRFATAHEMASALEAFGPARSVEVAGWVDETIGPTLRERAARVLAIERASAALEANGGDALGASSSLAVVRAARPADLPTAPMSVAEEPVLGSSAPVASTPAPTSRRRSAWVALGGAALAAALFFAWSTGRGSTMQHEPRPEASVGTATAEVPEVVPAAPAEAASAIALPSAAASASTPRSRAAAPARRPARPSCDPPYDIDARGIRVYKRECLDR